MSFIPLLAAIAYAQATQSIGLPDKFTPGSVKPADVVATVNGAPISAHDAEALLWEWRGPEVTEELISLSLIRQAAKKEGITVTQVEIEQRLRENLAMADKAAAQNPQNPNPGQTARQQLKDRGFPMSRLYLRTEMEVTADKIALKDFDPTKWVKVSTLVFRVADESAASIAAAAKKATTASDALKKGGTWADALKASGVSPAELANGGFLGWRNLSVFPDAVQRALPTLSVGKTTDPVKTQYGFQIFRLDAKGSNVTGADLDTLKQQYAQGQRGALMAKIRDQAKIERFPSKEPGE